MFKVLLIHVTHTVAHTLLTDAPGNTSAHYSANSTEANSDKVLCMRTHDSVPVGD